MQTKTETKVTYLRGLLGQVGLVLELVAAVGRGVRVVLDHGAEILERVPLLARDTGAPPSGVTLWPAFRPS